MAREITDLLARGGPATGHRSLAPLPVVIFTLGRFVVTALRRMHPDPQTAGRRFTSSFMR